MGTWKPGSAPQAARQLGVKVSSCLLTSCLSCWAGAPKAAVGLARAAKATKSSRLDSPDLYQFAIYDKQDLLYSVDRRQYNNAVLQALGNEDLTAPWLATVQLCMCCKLCDKYQNPV